MRLRGFMVRGTVCLAGLVLLGWSPSGRAATPMSGQSVDERLDRRRGDRQLHDRLSTPRLHENLRSELMQPQVRPAIRSREWREEMVPRPQVMDDQLDKQRRVRATLGD